MHFLEKNSQDILYTIINSNNFHYIIQNIDNLDRKTKKTNRNIYLNLNYEDQMNL